MLVCWMATQHKCCEADFFINLVVVVLLVLFAGIMSGLTLGLMSLSLVDLEVLAKSGTPKDRKHAERIMPVVQKQHLLLCTLLICNAAAMEALPIFLDSLFSAWGAILISVTLILLFGEIIPQSVCSRHGLAIGASLAPVVRILICICFPIAYPISKLLDCVLGKGHAALFRRAELKTLVNLHGNEAGKGGELTHDETTIIAGALELTEKNAKDAMTPLSQTFAVDINAKIGRELMGMIMDKGHSRVPVYHNQPTNIVGLILVKDLLAINLADEVPVRSVTIRKVPRVKEDMPLYDILNEFQKGYSHMAVVVRLKNPIEQPNGNVDNDVRLDIDTEQPKLEKKRTPMLPPLHKWKSCPSGTGNLNRVGSIRGTTKKRLRDNFADVLHINGEPLLELSDDEAIGIITMEDVIEELLQEEIYDEKDVHEDL